MVVLLAGLRFAAITSFAERKVEIVAIEAYPVSLSTLCGCARHLSVCDILDWSQVVHI